MKCVHSERVATYWIRIVHIAGNNDLHSIRKLPVEFIFQIEKFHRIRIFFGQFSAFESFFDLRQSVAGTHQIDTKHQQDQHFDVIIVDCTADFVSEKYHAGMFNVVQWIVRVVWIYAASVELSIDP